MRKLRIYIGALIKVGKGSGKSLWGKSVLDGKINFAGKEAKKRVHD